MLWQSGQGQFSHPQPVHALLVMAAIIAPHLSTAERVTAAGSAAYYLGVLERRVVALGVSVATLAVAGSAGASCVRMTAAEQRARADIVFDGVALDGATATGIERFRVVRYRKGAGPRIVRVRTGRKRYAGGGGVVTSVSIDAARGQTWRLYARRVRSGIFETNVCDGSRRLR